MRYMVVIFLFSQVSQSILAQSPSANKDCATLLLSAKEKFVDEDYDNARLSALQAVHCAESITDDNESVFIRARHLLADIYRENRAYAKADSLYSMLETKVANDKKYPPAYLVGLYADYAMNCLKAGKPERALDKFRSARYADSLAGRREPALTDQIHYGVASALYGADRSEEARAEVEAYHKKYKAADAEGRSAYLQMLHLQGKILIDLKEYPEAVRVFEDAAEAYIQRGECTADEEPLLWSDLAETYAKNDQTEKAFDAYKHSLKCTALRDGESSSRYSNTALELAVLYVKNGLYEQSAPHFLHVYRIAAEDTVNSGYLSALAGNLSLVYRKTGAFDEALKYALIGVDEVTRLEGTESLGYAKRLNNLVEVYIDLGMYEEALRQVEKSLEILRAHNGEVKLYIRTMGIQGSVYRRLLQSDKALGIQKDALEIMEGDPVFGEIDKAKGLNNVALALLDSDSSHQAVILLKQSIAHIETRLKPSHPLHIQFKNNLGMALEKSGDYTAAKEVYREVADMTAAQYGKDYTYYAPRLMSLGRCYDQLGMVNEAVKCYNEAALLSIEDIRRNFKFLSENRREDYLDRLRGRFSELHAFYFNHRHTFPELTGQAYNLELITKGMLLASETRIRDIVRSSGDSVLVNDFAHLLEMKELLNRQLLYPYGQRRSDFDDFREQVSRAESEFAGRVNNHEAGVDEDLRFDWAKIRNGLPAGSRAVEFVFYEDEKSSELKYSALVLGPDYPFPVAVALCTEEQLRDALPGKSVLDATHINTTYRGAQAVRTDSDSSASLYDLVWKPLEVELESADRLYYAPVGLLHTISFAALKNEEWAQYLCERKALRQMSSTGLMLKPEVKVSHGDLKHLFVGGIDYGKSAGVANNEWKYLKGTSDEIVSISRMAKAKGIRADTLTGRNATEAAFKEVAGDYDLIHVATHGFFYSHDPINASNVQSNSGADRESSRIKSSLQYQSNPLFRSGLVMAGANEDTQVNGSGETDDNKMTAAEVSHLDLSKTRIMVLSACETGLGDIKGNEGVYGLQRGLKMAGVRTLVYSLWPVPDAETAEFMQLFYSILWQGTEPEDAFEEARSELIRKYPPYFWAGFVMVD